MLLLDISFISSTSLETEPCKKQAVFLLILTFNATKTLPVFKHIHIK